MKKNQPLDQESLIEASDFNSNAKLQNPFEASTTIMQKLRGFALSVPDFRRTGKGNVRHRLADIIMLMILGRMCGHVGRADIIEFGKHNLKKFRKRGMLLNGVPSEATLYRAEHGIDDQKMAEKMQAFAENAYAELRNTHGVCHAPCDKEIICIDGKSMRGTVQENSRNPDIVSAYYPELGITIATEACREKSNEIKAIPLLINKIDIMGKIVTADAMSMQKDIIELIRKKGGDFLIELKANQRALRYGVEDKIIAQAPLSSYTQGPELGHGRIETRTYNIYDGLEIIADKEKWGGNMTIVEYISDTVQKSTGEHTSETRLYVTSLPPETHHLGGIERRHWSIESMHWGLDRNLKQDDIKRRSSKAARNLDSIQRIVFSVFSIWKGLRKKLCDKTKGVAQLMRHVKMSFTRLLAFLDQK